MTATAASRTVLMLIHSSSFNAGFLFLYLVVGCKVTKDCLENRCYQLVSNKCQF
jgi:hypothetical protein